MMRNPIEQTRAILLQRIDERLEALGLSQQAAELQAFGTKDTIRNWRRKPIMPRVTSIDRLAATLQTSSQYLLGQTNNPAQPQPDSTPSTAAQAILPEMPPRQAMPLDVPVMGTAAGSFAYGAFQLEGGIVDYVRRPPGLMAARDVYALYVEGTSMEPEFKPGELIFIHPHKPARIGDAVVVQTKRGEHDGSEATLGIYVRRTERHIVLRKHNPPAEIQILHNGETKVQKVLTMAELFGV